MIINSVTGKSELDSPKQMQILRPSFPLPAPSLLLDQTEARRAKKIFWATYFWLVVRICDIVPSRYLAEANIYDGGLKVRTREDSVNLS